MSVPEPVIVAFVIGTHVAAPLVLLWALFGDLSKGRKRCPRCWYDMSAVTLVDVPVECPECGRRITSDAMLHRTKLKRRVAVFMALLMGVGAYFWWQRLPGRGMWRGLVQNFLLIEIVDDPFAQAEPASTLRARINGNQLTPAQMQRVAERVFDEWISSGRPSALIKAPAQAPVGEPVVLNVNRAVVPFDLDVWSSYILDAGPGVAEAIGFDTWPADVHVNWGSNFPPAPIVATHPLHEGTNSCEVTLRLRVAADFMLEPAWSFERTVSIPFTIVGKGTLEDYLTPTPSQAVEGVLVSELSFSIENLSPEAGSPNLWLCVSFDWIRNHAWGQAFPNGVVVYDLILESDGELLAEVAMHGPFASGSNPMLSFGIPLLPMDDPALEDVVDPSTMGFRPGPLQVRFRSRAGTWSAQFPSINRSWVGDFSIPLSCYELDDWWDVGRGTHMDRETFERAEGR